MRSVLQVGFLAAVLAACILFSGCGSTCNDYESQVRACLDEYCAIPGASQIVCECWAQGKDVDTDTCSCMPLVWDNICSMLEASGVDPAGVIAYCPTYVVIKSGTCLQ